MSETNRRGFITGSMSALAAGTLGSTPAIASATAAAQESTAKPRRNRIAVSTYSYWRFRKDSKLSIEECIDLAADAGFDGVEILHISDGG